MNKKLYIIAYFIKKDLSQKDPDQYGLIGNINF